MSKDKLFDLNTGLSRRQFLIASSLAGAGFALGPSNWARAQEAEELQESQDSNEPQELSADKNPGDLNVAIIGVGAQGRVLIESCLRIPGIRFIAVCDIWNYSQQYGSRFLKKYGHVVNVYEDYREMLGKEKDRLDAVIVASPDWVHAEHAIACMQAGLHVYCEKEMSNSLEQARQMVLTSRQTGRLLQIGHQRRSNPRYQHAIDRLILQNKLLGRVTHSYGQWNRSKSEDLGWPKKYAIDQATLDKYGYESMTHFRNWRWYRKYGGGPIVDLGSHQIDLFSWVYGVNPKSVIASGGVDFYKNHEWFDNVLTIYEYENEYGVNRAFYQVLTTTAHGGFYETFMGEDGSIIISEVPQRGNAAERESQAPEWDQWVKKGDLNAIQMPLPTADTKNVLVDVRVTREVGKYPLPIELAKPAHQPHLENFFDAVRTGAALNCPGEKGYETAVAVLKVNEAVKLGQKLEFTPEEFVI